jgi:hypothetical protein
MKDQVLVNLLLQSLEHEMGGLKVYQTAIECAQNPGLKQEWQKYLGETEEHVATLQGVLSELGIVASDEPPSRLIVRSLGESLVQAMNTARAKCTPAEAELVACECVVLAETKDHLDWELLSQVARDMTGDSGTALQEACETVEDQEDEHLYHSKGWCRELWLKALGKKAVLPPPEERKNVKTAIGAARAEQSREEMIGKKPEEKSEEA